ncbi:hypothetical protein [Acinetobacter sp. ANC 4173]|uniref:hypothetical protein n=1 Tax=Acinetobacter sp. ANC 4173 TaxID=2529837 RepID=UPI00103FE049|nr:hypothetical protein [Acinetobacter sp. ANC 4173]TCB77912.1 hypothetical protein E0H94_13720 [Acinetobacter sp. ANC 4173]
MAQEKQNNLRILKANPAKPQKRSSIYVIAGFVGGIILSCGFFGFYLYAQNAEKTVPSEIERDHVETVTDSSSLETKPIENATTADEDIDYPNQINEQEMSALFKHSVNTTTNPNTHTQNSSPFANLGQQPELANKEASAIERKVQKHQPVSPTAKPPAQGVVKPALLNQLDKEVELAQPQVSTSHPSSPDVQSN